MALVIVLFFFIFLFFSFFLLCVYVTPRPIEYGNTTATYIRRVKYPYIYTLSISVQSGIRIRKNSGNIHSNITIQVHCYYRHMTGILSHHRIQNMITGDLHRLKVVDALEQEGGKSLELAESDRSEDLLSSLHASAAPLLSTI